MREKGCLYIIPNTIGNVQIDSSIPVEVKHIINNPTSFNQIGQIPLNKNTNSINLELNILINFLKKFIFIYRYLKSLIIILNTFIEYYFKC